MLNLDSQLLGVHIVSQSIMMGQAPNNKAEKDRNETYNLVYENVEFRYSTLRCPHSLSVNNDG